MSRSLIDRKLLELAKIGWFSGSSGSHPRWDLYRNTAAAVTTATVPEQAGLWQDGSPQQDRALTQTWFTPEDDTLAPLQAAAAFDPALFAGTLQPAHEERLNTATWFTPEADTLGIPPFAFTTATVPEQAGLWQDGSGQQDRAITQTWFTPEDDTLAPLQAAAAFDPALFAGTLQPAHEERLNTATWFTPEAELERGIPPFAFTTATVPQQAGLWQDGSGQQDRAITATWFTWSGEFVSAQPELPPTRLWAGTVPDPGEPAFGRVARSGTWDVGVIANNPLRLRPTRASVWTNESDNATSTGANQNVYLHSLVSPPLDGPQRIDGWFRANMWASETLATADARAQVLVRLVSEGGVDKGTLLAFDNSALTNEFAVGAIVARRFPVGWNNTALSPLDAIDGDRVVVEVGFRAAASGANITVFQQQDPTLDLDEFETDAFSPINSWFQFSQVLRFRAETDIAWAQDSSGQQDRAITATWFTPEAAEAPGIPPFAFTTATVPQQDGLWQDGSGQQDRAITATWFTPEDDTLAPLQAAAAPFDPSVGAAGLMFEATAVWQSWFSPDMFEPHFAGTLQAWLQLTWDLTPRTGVIPPIFIDADTGDPYIHLTGPMIVRAD